MKRFICLLIISLLLLSSCASPDLDSGEAGKVIPLPNKSAETTVQPEPEDELINEISILMPDGTNYWPTYAWTYRHLRRLQTHEVYDDYPFSAINYYLNGLYDKFNEDIDNGKSNSSVFGFFKNVTIAHQGHIVYEYNLTSDSRFENNYGWSLTKSFVSALVGIAIDEGYITLDDKILDYFTDLEIENINEWKEAMTIRDVLTMQSGLKWDDNISTRTIRGDNPMQVLLSAEMEYEPGTMFNYNTASSSILTTILQKVTGKTVFEYAEEKLFLPIGITSAEWDADSQGVNIGGFGLSMTNEDYLRFGYLYLHNGVWEGKQIVPSEWVKESTSTQVDLMINGSKKAEEFKDSGSYGYHWWTPSGEYDINVKSDSNITGGRYDEESESIKYHYWYFHNNEELNDGDLYRATGYAGQYIYVIPKYDLVIAISGTVTNSPVDIGNYLVLNRILPSLVGYGEFVYFDDQDEFDAYCEEQEIDYSQYVKSDYLF